MAFYGRLAEAAAEAKAESKTIKKNDNKRCDDKKMEEEKDVADMSILDAVSEYIFDLFDANCMQEYAKLEAIEREAVELFEDYGSSPFGQEYTLEQSALHKKFANLFESFCEDYLKQEGYSIENFYEVVRVYTIKNSMNSFVKNKRDSERDGGEAESKEQARLNASEIIEMIKEVSDFELWASRVLERISERKEWQEHIRQLDTSTATF